MPPNRPTQHFNPPHRHTHKPTQTRHPRNPQTLPNLRSCRTSNEFRNSQDNFEKRDATLLKKGLWHRRFLESFAEFLRVPIL